MTMHFTLGRSARAIAAFAIAATAATGLAGCSGAGSAPAANASCTPAHKFTTVTPGTLTVATYDLAPYTKVSGNELSGIEGELLTKIAASECLSLTVTASGGAAAVIPAIQTGRADVAAGDWWRTKARTEIVSLSDPVLADQGAIISTKGLKTIGDLDGKKIGSVAGNLWNDQLGKVFGSNFAVYQDGESVFSDLAAGRIDAVIDNVASSVVRFQTSPIQGATIAPLPSDPRIPASAHPGQLNWPTNKSNSGLTAALNDQIKALRADGTIASILKKYGLDASAAEVGTPELL